MEDTKVKITLESNGSVVRVFEGNAALISVTDENIKAESIIYGNMSTAHAAALIIGAQEQEEYLKSKYDPLTIAILLFIEKKAKEEKNEETALPADGVLN